MRRSLLSTLALAACIVAAAAPAGAQAARKATSAAKKSTVKKSSTTKKASATKASALTSGAWKTVYTDPSVTVALDTTATQHNSDGTYDAHLRWRYAGDQRIGRNRAYRTMLQREMIDCSTLGVKPLAAQTFNAAGTQVSAFESTQHELRTMDWAKRAPGTSAAKAYAAVCGAVK